LLKIKNKINWFNLAVVILTIGLLFSASRRHLTLSCNNGDCYTCPSCPDCPSCPTGKPSFKPSPTEKPSPTPTDIPTPTKKLTPTFTPTNTPTATATLTPTPTDSPTNTPKPTATNTPKPTATPTEKYEPTATPIPTNTLTPTPGIESPADAPTPTPTLDSSFLIQGVTIAVSNQVLGGVDRFNPLVEGIKLSYSKVLGEVIGLPNAGPADNDLANLPTSNEPAGQTLVIPKLNLIENLYQGEILGDQLLMGDDEVLTAFAFGKQIIYAHNDSNAFGFINQLRFGNEIVRQTQAGQENYKVASIYWTNPNFVNMIKTAPDDSLILITCDRFNPNLRVVVIAEK